MLIGLCDSLFHVFEFICCLFELYRLQFRSFSHFDVLRSSTRSSKHTESKKKQQPHKPETELLLNLYRITLDVRCKNQSQEMHVDINIMMLHEQ